MEQKIEINGNKYVLESSIKTTEKAKPKKGLDYCIVRTYSAGVFAGFYDTKTKGKEGIVFDARRIWKWDGAASLSQFAVNGTNKPNTCKVPCSVEKVYLKEIIEVIPCTEKSKKSIESIPVWEE